MTSSPLEKISEIINKVDKVDLISRLALYETINQQPGAEEVYNVFKDDPALPFLIGLCLKEKNNSVTKSTPDQIQTIINEIKNYFNHYKMEGFIKRDNPVKEDLVILDAKQANLVSQINPKKYHSNP